MVGQSIENYSIEELLGQGGMGSVYRALDTSLDRVVALKIMNPGLATNADFLRRFKSEARVLGRLQHPHIVNVYTFRHIDSHLFIVMEYIGGGTLNDMIDHRGPLPLPQAIDILKQSLSALEFAHSSNIIHRDIKPPNILLTKNHRVKVSDFGLAKIQEDSSHTMVTRVGMTGGTLHYMPPEQTEALSNVDHRGDLYSLGMSFYQMLAGRVPFDKNSSAFSILRTIDQQRIPSPDTFNPHIPRELVDFVMRSIKKYPKDRFQNAAEMRMAIEQYESRANQGSVVEKTQIYSSPKPLNETVKLDFQPQRLFQKSGQDSKRPSSSSAKTAARKKGSSSGVKKKQTASKSAARQQPPKKQEPSRRKVLIPVVAVIVLSGLVAIFALSRGNSTSDPTDFVTTVEPTSGGTDASGTAGTDQQPENPTDPGQVDTPPDELPSTLPGSEPGGDSPTSSTGSSQPPASTPSSGNPSTSPSTSSQGVLRTVTIRSNPEGADILFDGRRVGKTPYRLAGVTAGSHRVQLTLDGYQTYESTIDASTQSSLLAELTPARGMVRVVVRPYGDIYINGEQKVRQTNSVFEQTLPTGNHVIRAEHPVLGYWEKRIRIDGGENEDVFFFFDNEYKVTVISNPLNAEIVVDGKSTGRFTPRELRLPAGNHSITVRKDGFTVVGDPIRIVLESDLDEALEFILNER